jgi:oligopeptide/dipeptide ABC transporter ATP-binding protein
MSPASEPTSPVLELKNLVKSYNVRSGIMGKSRELRILENISFTLNRGEILSIVGESGCGKTTVGKVAAGLIKPTSGEILYHGKNPWTLPKHEFAEYRRKVQMIHQDPYQSLNPVHRIYDIISAPLFRHKKVKNSQEAREKVRELLQRVDLSPVDDFIDKNPHQLSGGQRQRVSIARTLTVDPEFIVADEAVSMLDISIRLAVVDLMLKLKEELGVTYLFITHDLAIAKYFGKAGRIAVMYLGRMVETGPTLEIIRNPMHPYTRILLSSIPEADPEKTRSKKSIQLRSLDIPSLMDLPTGCKFHPRCPLWLAGKCDKEEPVLKEASPGHWVSCFNPQSGPVAL